MVACDAERGPRIAADYVFERVHVVPMHEEATLRNRAVAVKDGKIVAIVDQSEADKIDAASRVDGEGRYLMPGLADMHVHIRWNPETMFKLFLAKGVTTVFNMRLADGEDNHLELRENIASGEMIGPRYLLSGPQLHSEELPDVEAVVPMLDRHVDEAYDLVKIHGDLPPDVYDALIAGARERALRIGGHSQHNMPLEKTLEIDSLEHVEEFLYVARDDRFSGVSGLEDFLSAYRANAEQLWDPVHRALVVQDVAASGIFLNPTLIVYSTISTWADDERLKAMRDEESMMYLPKSVKDHWLSLERNPYQEEDFPMTVEEVEHNVELLLILMKELHDGGVPLLSGTDGFGTLIPGFSLHQELALMDEAGLTPYEALRTSTVNVAAYLGESEVEGAIRPGFRADFILLDQNPLDDIENASGVSGVFTSGRWYSRAELNSFLEGARN